ncbi:MAG: LysR family transcriptional regulator [Chromatiaceae bacterium]|nr:LysR family transcriptional regulator [Chromatiaceae bacterium]
MDLLLLHSFLVVAESGGVTAAATRLHITQPALSRRLQQLEEQLGAPLLDRGRRGVQLTELGRLVQREGRLIVARYELLKERVRAHQQLREGTVRIGGGATAVSFVLPAAIARFQAAYPSVRFQVKEAGSSEVARDVRAGQLEVGLVTLPVQGRELEVRPLMMDRIVLVARPDHPLAGSGRIRARELDGLPFVGFEGGTAIRQIIDTALRDAGVEMNIVMELRSIPAILRMVASTGNLAFVSQVGVESNPDVTQLSVRDLRIERQLAVVIRQGAHLSPAAAAFLDQLDQSLGA